MSRLDEKVAIITGAERENHQLLLKVGQGIQQR